MKPYNSLRIKAKSEPKPSRWEWLNKPIVLWFLSSVVVTGITLSYGTLQANRQAEAQNSTTLERLRVAIEVRRDIASRTLFELRRNCDMEFHQKKEKVIETIRNFINGSPNNAVFPEYRDSSILGLSYQMKEMGKSKVEFSGIYGNEALLEKADDLSDIEVVIDLYYGHITGEDMKDYGKDIGYHMPSPFTCVTIG